MVILESLARICASELSEHNGLYLVDDAPFTGVAYFLEDDRYNGAYYIKEGLLQHKHHEAVLLQHQDKPWVPWKNIVSFFHEEVLDGTNYDLDEPYMDPYLYQDKPFTGIWVCFEERFKGTKYARTCLRINAVEHGTPVADISIMENGHIAGCFYNDTIKRGEEFISNGIQGGVEELIFWDNSTADVHNSISVKYTEEQVHSITIHNDIFTPGLKEIYAKSIIKSNYYNFDLKSLEYRDKLNLSGKGITKQQLQFLFASSLALPKILMIGKLETLSKEALNYCKQELNMRCVDRHDVDY